MPDTVSFRPWADVIAAAEQRYAAMHRILSQKVPFALAIEHVGSTSISGCLTKGDLDIAVRVTADAFVPAERELEQILQRNTANKRYFDYASFVDEGSNPPCGVQLVTAGGRFDFFVTFRDALKTSGELLEEYNDLKAKFQGKSMSSYRKAKAKFVSKVLGFEERVPSNNAGLR
jgi:GrpB-like predicted nucleotidyltransferase (UPF0157 family)